MQMHCKYVCGRIGTVEYHSIRANVIIESHQRRTGRYCGWPTRTQTLKIDVGATVYITRSTVHTDKKIVQKCYQPVSRHLSICHAGEGLILGLCTMTTAHSPIHSAR